MAQQKRDLFSIVADVQKSKRQKFEQEFVNPSFDIGEELSSNDNVTDIVDQIIRKPGEVELHPYGRGNMYANAFKGKKVKVELDGEKFMFWLVFGMMVVGAAAGIVILADTGRNPRNRPVKPCQPNNEKHEPGPIN